MDKGQRLIVVVHKSSWIITQLRGITLRPEEQASWWCNSICMLCTFYVNSYMSRILLRQFFLLIMWLPTHVTGSLSNDVRTESGLFCEHNTSVWVEYQLKADVSCYTLSQCPLSQGGIHVPLPVLTPIPPLNSKWGDGRGGVWQAIAKYFAF